MPRQDRSLRLRLTLLPVLIVIAFIGSCASAGGTGAAGEGGIQIQVDNNLIPSINLSISAVTSGATPVRLGSVMAGAEQTFTFRPTVSGATFSLVADRPGPSGSLVSEPITIPTSGTGRVEWELATNNVVVR